MSILMDVADQLVSNKADDKARSVFGKRALVNKV